MSGFQNGTRHPGGIDGPALTPIGTLSATNAPETLGALLWDNSPDDPGGLGGPSLFQYLLLDSGATVGTGTLAKGNLVIWSAATFTTAFLYQAISAAPATRDATTLNVRGAMRVVHTAGQLAWVQKRGYTATLQVTTAPAAIGGVVGVDTGVASGAKIAALGLASGNTAAIVGQTLHRIGRMFVTTGTSGAAYLEID